MKSIFVLLAMLAAAFASYNYNFFRVTSDVLFESHQVDSERLVLDGILHGSIEGNQIRPGAYIRPGNDNPRLSYAKGDTTGEFVEYQSQYGMQARLYAYLARTISGDIRLLHGVSSLLMSLIVVLLFNGLCREFSRWQSFLFCATLILSPWVVIFARNLYWMEATWFLPMVLTLYQGKQAFASNRATWLMGGSLFAAFFIKCLCGYEYLSTVGIAACVPLAYYLSHYRFSIKRGLVQATVCGVSLTLAFLLSVGLHVLSLDAKDGFQHVLNVANKRLSTSNIPALAEAIARESGDPEAAKSDFIRDYEESLKSSRLHVVLKYLAMPHFIPWVDRVTGVISQGDRALLRGIKDKPGVDAMRRALLGVNKRYLLLASASVLTFLMLNGYAGYIVIKRKNALSLALLAGVAAPLSWFILAKGHSYGHTQINYVLWYVPYIPWVMLTFASPVSSGPGRASTQTPP